MNPKVSFLMRPAALILALALAPLALHAQWTLQDSRTTADLRGIDNIGNGIAWASGTNGTILRTTDSGAHWQLCTTPPNADHLDFRGIQAFDNNTAIVMSSGPGDQSRLYKTTDACQSWTLLFTNPDKTGFWDAIKFVNDKLGFILGDPVSYRNTYKPHQPFTGFAIFATQDGGMTFKRAGLGVNLANPKTSGAFAASNSSLFIGWPFIYFGGGGASGARVYLNAFQQHIGYSDSRIAIDSGEWRSNSWTAPFASRPSAGIFALAFMRGQRAAKENEDGTSALPTLKGIAVGGDYLKPNGPTSTAAFTTDGGQHWLSATTPPTAIAAP